MASLHAEHVAGEQGSGSGEWSMAGSRQHSLFKRLSNMCGEVNAMTVFEIKKKLQALTLSSSGTDEVLRKRLKQHLRSQLIYADPSAPPELISQVEVNPYGLDYLCILDFEATCEEQNPVDYIHEVIEFPVLLLNIKTLRIDAEFHCYCRPLLNHKLSEFCKRLTGIKQDQVEEANTFSEVFTKFTEWLEDKQLGSEYKFALVTDCPWDINECLFPQCVFARVPFPKYATKWIDMRKLFASFYQMRSGNLSRMLESVGLHFEGREHCGLDDARNIARVVEQLIKDGCVLKYNRFIPDDVLSSFGFSGGGRSRKKR